jgi:hypothetical protein
MGSKENGTQTVTKKTAINNVSLLSEDLKSALLAKGLVTVHLVREVARGSNEKMTARQLRDLIRTCTRRPSSDAQDADRVDQIFMIFGLHASSPQAAPAKKVGRRRREAMAQAAE